MANKIKAEAEKKEKQRGEKRFKGKGSKHSLEKRWINVFKLYIFKELYLGSFSPGFLSELSLICFHYRK